ncbi:hypothetical protein FH966_03080 [Lentibacillus cibarius]|uniref:Uncharacterized protein n=1 Tax=Lentibacillus cibarius TaxID=2583219 RepID=A0A549YFW3_9BACI|nr:hypothetical protein [Lentibacillus cibarius]TRM10780.1 hypothetical protein FH966_03080 [Lentibacillus cibarius]
MKWVLMRVSLSVLGVVLFGLVLLFETDGVLGFIMASVGLGLIFIGLTLEGIVKLIMDVY